MSSPSTGITQWTFKTRLKHTMNYQKTNARYTSSWLQRMVLPTTTTITWSRTKWPWMTCLGHDSCIRIPYEATTNVILHDMFTQFSEIPSPFIHGDKVKGVKRLLFSPQYIEHKFSIFNWTPIRMKERKNIVKRLVEVIRPFKTGIITMFSPVFSLLEAYCNLINVKYVKNEIFENYFEQFSYFSTV